MAHLHFSGIAGVSDWTFLPGWSIPTSY